MSELAQTTPTVGVQITRHRWIALAAAGGIAIGTGLGLLVGGGESSKVVVGTPAAAQGAVSQTAGPAAGTPSAVSHLFRSQPLEPRTLPDAGPTRGMAGTVRRAFLRPLAEPTDVGPTPGTPSAVSEAFAR